MEQRKMFVTSEPELGEYFCVVVSVRHPEKGLIRRMFVSEHKMKEVYDCVGSFSMYPMYFDLCDYQKRVYQYADTIGSCRYILNMFKRDAPNELVISDDSVDLSGNAFDVGDTEKERFFRLSNSQTSQRKYRKRM